MNYFMFIAVCTSNSVASHVCLFLNEFVKHTATSELHVFGGGWRD